MSRLKRIWQTLTRPWLSTLLRDAMLCRITVLAVMVLGVAHLAGFSLMPCPFYGVTRLPCPGCGMTRAFIAFFRGEWGAMVTLHPFAPVFVTLGALMGCSAVAPLRAREVMAEIAERVERRTRLPALLLLSFALFGLLRVGFFFFMSPHAVFSSAVF
jgi:hypothetical protein